MSIKINPKIFKAYDVRGLYPEEINEDAVFSVARAFVEFLRSRNELKGRPIIVGRDARLSSADLVQAALDALVLQGADVVDIGPVSTPCFYWAIISQQAGGGLMITASHNPSNYNGLKVCGPEARSLGFESGLATILELTKREIPAALTPGKVLQKDILADYVSFVEKQSSLAAIKPLKLVIDCGNGMAGPEVVGLFKNFAGQVEFLFSEPDGRFPNHEANPSKEETLAILKEKMAASQADLGAAFDGDADRIVFVDEKKEAARGDFITALLGKEFLKKEPGQKIFYEVRSSKIIPEVIAAAGGQAVLGRPGHALIKEQMRQEGILFGGELSGHYFYRSLGFIENPLFTLLEVLRLLSREHKTLSQLIHPFKKYWHSGEINFKTADPEAILAAVAKKYDDAQIKWIDGLTAEYSDWWFNLRKSNTEPLVRLNLEAQTPGLLEEKKRELINFLRP